MRYKCVCLCYHYIRALFLLIFSLLSLCLFFALSLFALVYFRFLHTISAAIRKKKGFKWAPFSRGRWEEVCVRRAENGSGPCKCGQKVQARPLEIQAVQQQQQRRQQQWQWIMNERGREQEPQKILLHTYEGVSLRFPPPFDPIPRPKNLGSTKLLYFCHNFGLYFMHATKFAVCVCVSAFVWRMSLRMLLWQVEGVPGRVLNVNKRRCTGKNP